MGSFIFRRRLSSKCWKVKFDSLWYKSQQKQYNDIFSTLKRKDTRRFDKHPSVFSFIDIFRHLFKRRAPPIHLEKDG